MATPALKNSPLPRDAQQALRALGTARERTLALVAELDDEQLERVHSPIMSPLVWDLAHIAAYEDLWLGHRHGRLELLRPELAALYDAFETPRAIRGQIEALGPDDARAYMSAVRARTEEVIAERGVGDGVLCELVLRHELQHAETMRQTMAIAELLPDAEAAGARAPLAAGDPPAGWLEVPGGPFAMGAGADGFAYDNELPRHSVDLSAFALHTAPREQPELDELQRRRRLRAPRVVVARGLGMEGGARHHPSSRRGERPPGGARVPRLLVRGRRLRACAPLHDARLPTEAEGEGATTWTQQRSAQGLAGVGRVWEWTASQFVGYPGFEPYPYREYSQVFFGPDYRVLRGGSWASDPRVATLTFRNWDLPQRRQIFAGVRLAREL